MKDALISGRKAANLMKGGNGFYRRTGSGVSVKRENDAKSNTSVNTADEIPLTVKVDKAVKELVEELKDDTFSELPLFEHELMDRPLVVSCDGKVAAYVNGVFTGDSDIVVAAKKALQFELDIPLFGGVFKCEKSSIIGVLAALHFYNAGRTTILKAPTGLLDELTVLRDFFVVEDFLTLNDVVQKDEE